MPNQGKIQQEDGHAFSTNDTKFRYRTQNNGSPLAHAQVDSNFEIIRLTANGLVDDIKSNYDMIQLNKASIASLENRASELENQTSVNANDIAVNGVKIADNLEKIEVLNLLTAAQGVDLENNEEAISVNATAILNLDTKTTDNHTALETRVSNNEVSIANLVVSDQTNTENISQLQNDLTESVTRNGIFFGTSELTLEEIEDAFVRLDGRLEKFFTTTDNSDGLTLPTITAAIDQAAKAVVSNDEDISDLQSVVAGLIDELFPDNFNRVTGLESDVASLQQNLNSLAAVLTSTNNSVQTVVDSLAATQNNVTQISNQVSSATGGYFSSSKLVNSGTGAKNTTVKVSNYGVPSTAKWGIFWTHNDGNDWPNHATYVFPNSSFTNGAMVYFNASDKSQYGGVQFMAPIVNGHCYITSQENSSDSWKLYFHGWA